MRDHRILKFNIVDPGGSSKWGPLLKTCSLGLQTQAGGEGRAGKEGLEYNAGCTARRTFGTTTPPILSWVTRLTDSGGQITNLEFDFWRASLTWLSFGWLPVGLASQLARLSFQLARLRGHLPTGSAQLRWLPRAAAQVTHERNQPRRNNIYIHT